WAAPGYLMLVPLLGSALNKEFGSQVSYRWVKGTAIFVIFALCAVMAQGYLAWPPFGLREDLVPANPFLDLVNWTDLEKELEARGLLQHPNLFIATHSWEQAGKIDYALHGKVPVLCLGNSAHEYGILRNAKEHLGDDALIIGPRLSRSVLNLDGGYFESVEELPPVTIFHAGKPALELSIFFAHTLRAGPSPRRTAQ